MPVEKQSQAVQTPAEHAASIRQASYWRWLERVRDAFRVACHGDARLLADCVAKVMAKGIAADLQAEESPGKRWALVLELGRRKEPSGDEEVAAAALFKRRQAVRDALVDRLGKIESQPWDDFYADHATPERIGYVGELMIELGAISSPQQGVRPSQRRPIDDPKRNQEAEAVAAAWTGSAEPGGWAKRKDLE